MSAIDINVAKPLPIQCTAGAIPFLNEKGEISMKKVKVQRYVSGKRPDFAPSSSDESEGNEDNHEQAQKVQTHIVREYQHKYSSPESVHDLDRPERKNQSKETTRNHKKSSTRTEDINKIKQAQILEKLARHKQMHKENNAKESESETETSRVKNYNNVMRDDHKSRHKEISSESGSDKEDSDENEEEIQKRRLALRQKILEKIRKAKEREKEKEKLSRKAPPSSKITKASRGDEHKSDKYLDENLDEGVEEEESEEESDEEEEESEDEGFDVFSRHQHIKPVFVQKKDRVTIKEKEDDEEKQRLSEIKAKKVAEERRRETLKIVEEEIKREHYNPPEKTDVIASNNLLPPENPAITSKLEDIDTDDEIDEETSYESWKSREAERLKRDKEEKERMVREKMEIERWHSMTEEERAEILRLNPKLVTNRPQKGKYRFLQKYYHRGAFYLDEEEDVLKRDVSAPTLEDHFDKTVMPKIMQVKNFGKAGRTKYTHLVDQDTTLFDSPWTSHNPQNIKFINNQSGGMKQIFNRPSKKKL